MPPVSHATAHPSLFAQPRPETVEFGGLRYQDPFRWLEDDSNPDVIAWQTAQDQKTQAHLENLPGLSIFADGLRGWDRVDEVSVPINAGGRWFTTRVPEDRDLSVVTVSDKPTSRGRPVIDLNTMHKGEPLQLISFVPSPDGHKAVFAWSEGGRESWSVRVIDVDTGQTLLHGLPQAQAMGFVWLPDSTGFLYTAIDYENGTGCVLHRYVLGAKDQPTAEAITLSHPVVRPVVAADNRHVLLVVDHLAPRPHYILDLAGDGQWRPFLKDLPGIIRGDVIGEEFIAIVDDGASRGRLVSIPLASPTSPETWREIVPASEDVPAALLVTGDRALLLDLVDTYARLRVFDRDGRLEGEVELPGRGMITGISGHYAMFSMLDPMSRAGDGQAMFAFGSPLCSPILCQLDVASRALTLLSRPERILDARVIDLDCRSADGARVAYHVIGRKDLDLSEVRPAVITGYGGFNIAVLPGWLDNMWATWIEAGGVVVLAHLRGGGEYGTPWWEEGRLKHKQNSFNDVFAIAQDLIARGVSSADCLGVTGASNGGVMAAAVAAQRPDLFRASVALVPITDVLARRKDPVTMVSSMDYGDPADPEMAPVLYAWSPYQAVRDGVDYPAILLDCGVNDPRCPPWHSRKFAARVQQATTGRHPVLLRVRADAGHGPVGRANKQQQSAEFLAFFAQELGLRLRAAPLHGHISTDPDADGGPSRQTSL